MVLSEEQAMELIIIQTFFGIRIRQWDRIPSTTFIYYNWQKKKELILLLPLLEDLVHHQEISPRLFK